MPRRSRVDAAGALHHVIGRGIARGAIFLSDRDRDDFLRRLGDILPQTNTVCYAWALIPNHFHLLLRTGTDPLSSVLKRLLTGYAVGFNMRHNRQGHLFQNRYKSILCQEEPYLLELVRYIHLNPLRARLVKTYEKLCSYPYCGQSVILGKRQREWQDADYVLGLFDNRVGAARSMYRNFVKQGIEKGNRPELVGGGLLRSQGGWSGVKALRESGDYQKGDERILGDGSFVQQVLSETEERLERRYHLRTRGYDFDRIVERVSGLVGITPEEVMKQGKIRGHLRGRARSLLCYWASTEIGVKQSRLAEILKVTQPAISMAVRRGAELVKEDNLSVEG
jgi:putative transposase